MAGEGPRGPRLGCNLVGVLGGVREARLKLVAHPVDRVRVEAGPR